MILSPHQHALGICQHTPLADVVEAHRALFGDAGTQPSLDYIATHPDATLSAGGPHLQHLAPEFIAILFDAIYNHHEVHPPPPIPSFVVCVWGEGGGLTPATSFD